MRLPARSHTNTLVHRWWNGTQWSAWVGGPWRHRYLDSGTRFMGRNYPDTKKAQAIGLGFVLPRLDSNQEPSG